MPFGCMAKKNKKSKVEKDLSRIDTSVKAIVSDYSVLTKTERKTVLKKLEKEEKRLVKHWLKTQEKQTNFDIARVQAKIKRIENQNEKVKIDYGFSGMSFFVKKSYLENHNNIEKFLDYQYSRKMKSILNKVSAPKTKGEARQLEGLITLYSKKLKNTNYYNAELVENSLNKLKNFENFVISDYKQSDFISKKNKVIQDEINIFRAKEIEKTLKKDEVLFRKIERLEKKASKDKRRLKKKEKEILKINKIELKKKIENNKKDIGFLKSLVKTKEEEEEEEEEEMIKYISIIQPITIDGNLMGLRFNFL